MNRFWTPYPGVELSVFCLRRAFPIHLHDALVVAVLVDGEEALCVDGAWYRAGPETAVVLEPQRAHANAPMGASGAHYRTFYISADLLSMAAHAPSVRLRTHVIEDRAVVRRLHDLHQALDAPASVDGHEVVDVFATLVADFSSSEPFAPPPDPILAAASLLREQCAKPLRWPAICRDLGYSPAYLARAFRRFIGVPPHTYQIQYRVALAKQLLSAHESVATVAHVAGFSDQSHLTRCFRTYVGETPARFRAQHAHSDAA